MYLTLEILKQAVRELKGVHSFFGITYLVCKRGKLPIGKTEHFPINKEEENILRTHYKPDVRSKHYYHPFKTSGRKKGWVVTKYPSAGSQSTRTRGCLSDALLHELHTDQWGWDRDYIEALKEQLAKDRTHYVPAFWVGAWLYRTRRWGKNANAETVIRQLFKEFCIGAGDRKRLFDTRVPKEARGNAFQQRPCTDEEILGLLPAPPDAQPRRGGSLRLLELEGVGPTKELSFEPAERLTMVTGDNGLGKTFLLECAWWSLTGSWAGRPAMPRLEATKKEPRITFSISGKGSAGQRTTTTRYDWENQRWPVPSNRPTIPGLIVYARVDGSFAVWDPLRDALEQRDSRGQEGAVVFTRDEVLDGLGGQIEGLIRDWVKWQHSPDPTTFETFKRMLKRLSPPEGDALEPSVPIRLQRDPREIPAIAHSYGSVPFFNESAGVRRIVTLGYLLVWAWSEHLVFASLAKQTAEKRMVVLIDEMEAHLHPKWQRKILPAILDVAAVLDEQVDAQVIVTTHSPLVLASVETRFEQETDKLYHLNLKDNGEVRFAEIPFMKQGSVDDWLTSDIFELRQARSEEGEQAVEQAKQVLRQRAPDKEELLEITRRLRASVSPDDVFWARWAYFLERKGVCL